MSRIRGKKRRTGLRIIAVMVMCICGTVILKRMDLEKDYNKKLAKVETLNQQIEEQEFEEEQLTEKKAYMQTKKFVEEVARDILGLVYEDEVIFKQNE